MLALNFKMFNGLMLYEKQLQNLKNIQLAKNRMLNMQMNFTTKFETLKLAE